MHREMMKVGSCPSSWGKDVSFSFEEEAQRRGGSLRKVGLLRKVFVEVAPYGRGAFRSRERSLCK